MAPRQYRNLKLPATDWWSAEQTSSIQLNLTDFSCNRYYLAKVKGLCTHRIIGRSVSDHNEAQLVCAALKKVVLTRGEVRAGIMHHSDRGST